MLTPDIRERFLKFFEKNGHKIVPSSSLVPENDPSLLFTNAGMVQFKNVFTGLETRPFKRATSSQKCVRAGGKHNDLDQVGFTARHHTFFEMLGNFSLGDYFKDQAIPFAWDFLTRELQLPKEKLLVTVFHTDEEAANIWRKVAGDITIIPISTSDNFWSMGDTGPCGPCSEIFYDRGDRVPGGMPGTPDEDGDRYMEIWNIVFMQFEQKENGDRSPLARKCIDTGMGLERIAAVMQNVDDNYLTDSFVSIIDRVKEISDTTFDYTYPSYKVIADHIRSVSFLIADGVVPSNEGRGYVLRRILRRAMRHGNLLNIKKPFLYELFHTVKNIMGVSYPELIKHAELIQTTIFQEEEKFLSTLDRGLKILQAEVKDIPNGGRLDGTIAFKLYDTYGFPLDLTQDILKAQKISVDVEGFESALQEQKQRAKWVGSGDVNEDKVWHSLKETLPTSEFVGYDKFSDSSDIQACVRDGEAVASLKVGEGGYLVTAQTPFYPEGGGQHGDAGVITSSTGKFEVANTIKFCGTIIGHYGRVIDGEINVGQNVDLQIYMVNRKRTMANHSATHLLQAALRKVFGDHIVQRGSSVDAERLRFDFSHSMALSEQDIKHIEDIVNDNIVLGFPVVCNIMSKDDAINAGAMALFGEKYADRVRTIQMGNKNEIVSFELCGGTHVSNTAEIGGFKIVYEGSIGSGIRRIEAITGTSLVLQVRRQDDILKNIASDLKCAPNDINERVHDILDELKQKKSEIQKLQQQAVLSSLNSYQIAHGMIYIATLQDYPANEMRTLNDCVRGKYPSGVIALISQSGDRFTLLISISNDLQSEYASGDLLKKCLAHFEGKGGGNPLFAQGGGKGKVEDVVDWLKEQ